MHARTHPPGLSHYSLRVLFPFSQDIPYFHTPKIEYMKNFFFITFLIAAFTGVASAQEAWKNYSRTDELEINYSYTECHDVQNDVHKSIIVLQLVNLTDKQISVSYNQHLWYDGKCRGCDNLPEQTFGIRLAPNETRTGSCEDSKTKALYVFDKMLNVKAAKLDKFELANIQITTAQ